MNLALLLLKRQLRALVTALITPDRVLAVVNYAIELLVSLAARVPGTWDDALVVAFASHFDEAKRKEFADLLTEKMLDWVLPLLPLLAAASENEATQASIKAADDAADLVCAEFCSAAKKSC